MCQGCSVVSYLAVPRRVLNSPILEVRRYGLDPHLWWVGLQREDVLQFFERKANPPRRRDIRASMPAGIEEMLRLEDQSTDDGVRVCALCIYM